MGVMGTLLQTVTNLITHDRAPCYRSSIATNSGANEMKALFFVGALGVILPLTIQMIGLIAQVFSPYI
jgi:hypothetical protein